MKICSAKDAGIRITTAVNSHADMWERIDNIEDYTIRLKKPFDPKQLEEAGTSWAANFNYGKGKSFIERQVGDNFADLCRSLAFIELDFCPYDKSKHKESIYAFLEDPYLSERIAYGLGVCLNEVLEHDKDFYSWGQKAEYCSFMFGHCSVTHDEESYLGYPNHPRMIAYEDRTKLNRVDNFVIFGIMKPNELWDHYNDAQGMQGHVQEIDGMNHTFYDNGWCKEGMEEVFCLVCPCEDTDDARKNPLWVKQQTWENVELVIKKIGISSFLYNVRNIFIGKIYEWDKDGNFTETYVVTKQDNMLNCPSDSARTIDTNKYLLFQKTTQKNISEVINVIREYSMATSDFICDLSGHGSAIAADSIRFDLKKCGIEDKLTIGGNPFFRQTSAFSGENAGLCVMGGFNVVAEGVTMEPTQYNFSLDSHLKSLEVDEQNFGREMQHVSPQMNLSSRPSTEEVSTQQTEVSRIRSSRIPVKLSDYSIVFLNILRNLGCETYKRGRNKEIQDWFFKELKKEFKDIDIDEKDFSKLIESVQTVRLSPVNADINALQKAMSMASSSSSRQRLNRMYLIALGFSRKDAWEIVAIQDYGTQTAMAALENNAFKDTAEVVFGFDQDHITHLNIHYGKADRMMKSVSGGGDPVVAFNTLVNLLTNTEKHLMAIDDNPFYESKVKEFEPVQQYFTLKTKELARLIEQMKAQAQQQSQQGGNGGGSGGLSPKDQAAIYNDRMKTIAKIERTNEQSQATMQRKERESQFKIAQKQEEHNQRLQATKDIAALQAQMTQLTAAVQLSTQNNNGNPG